MDHKKLFFKAERAGFLPGAVLLVTLTGCVGYVDGPRAGIQVEPYAFAVQDDYVYSYLRPVSSYISPAGSKTENRTLSALWFVAGSQLL
jgi:hypothetical protein